MTLLDSRRLTGPGLLLDRAGAAIEVAGDGVRLDRAAGAWAREARRMLDRLGWTGETLAVRRYPGGASLALSAPVDALYAATEVNEWAWDAATAGLDRRAAPDFEKAAKRLAGRIRRERRPRLVAIREAARARGLTFLSDADHVSAGSGTGVRVWRTRDLPSPARIHWGSVHDIPVALVTGSNGKTTVVRLLGAMVAAAGQVVGTTSTDGVAVGGNMIAEGDYSGPSGARMVLRRREVETAILETARGGMLRRGLAVERADAAVVTNVADDHLGEFGVTTMGALAETKLLVARAVGSRGAVVLNADDPVLVEASERVLAPVIWFSLRPDSPTVTSHLASGGRAVIAQDGAVALAAGAQRTPLASLAEVPIAFGGAALHNVANALAAAGAAAALGIPIGAIGAALRRFGRDPDDNPGRANLLQLGGAQILIDYAHNPHGMAALERMTAGLPATRRLVLLGQAGDRGDEAIRQLARGALALRPDRVVVKEMERYLRGRAPGEVPRLIADELVRRGLSRDVISQPGSELASVRAALAWARPGDLLVLAVHQDRAAVLELLHRLRARRWQAGEPVG